MFVDREKELEILKGLKRPRVAVVGRRRVGKTTLVEHGYKNILTLFIPAEKTENEIISDWVDEYPGLSLPRLSNFREFFEYLFVKEKDRLVFIDELQNVVKVNRSFIYDLQRLLDKHKDCGVVVSGSYISVMKNLIEDYKSPLYGRFDFIIRLRELDFRAVLMLCSGSGYSFEDAMRFYLVFGGIPKYYETLERMGNPSFADAIKGLFMLYPRPLNEEIRAMLREEFGTEHKMYFTILTAVAAGKNSLKEIADYSGRKPTELTKYLNVLRDEFEILRREIPATERKTKKGKYVIASNVFSFWLYFVWRHYYLLERNLDDEIADIFEKGIGAYLGRRYEALCGQAIGELDRAGKLPFRVSSFGRQWGQSTGGEAYEIDLVALSRNSGEILFCECKWSENVDAADILSDLVRKASFVGWNKGKRKEYFAIFARSFKKRTTEKNVLLFDSKDLEKLFSGDTVRSTR